MFAKILVASAIVLSAPAAFACSFSPMGASTLQMSAVIDHVGKLYSSDFEFQILKIEAVNFNTFRVTLTDRTGQKMRTRAFAVGISANCSTTVKEIKQ